MQILKVRYSEEPENGVAVRMDAVESMEEIELAYHLAESAFRNRKTIAKKMEFEFLLWLSGTRDIKNAIRKTAPKKGEECLLIDFSDKGKGEKIELRKKADPLRLEMISLSRI
jgi:tRNA threonylcarbamoyladenosine modification (KEOPS) complex Cgi121 subunit